MGVEYLEEALCDWFDAGLPASVAVPNPQFEEDELWPVTKPLRALLGDDTVLPGAYTDAIALPEGSTFGEAAEELLRRRRKLIRR